MRKIKENELWYKDAVIYEVHVKSFFDSNQDGIGDFKGLTMKLDYLESLGVNAIWLLPFYPSPLKDDGYDISDYEDVHPNYGDLLDFKRFLGEAHRRNIKVITELVLNHTSDKHIWFQNSRKAKKGSYWKDFYVWSDSPEKYKDARIIFKDIESSNWAWDPEVKAYYWHRFYSHQPDLNYDNPAVHEEIFKVVDFWLNIGVDGLRLDAVPYLYEREGTNCENLPETFAFLEKIRTHIDRKFENRMLLAEANQWPEDAVKYFGSGNRCHMAFHFPLMPRLFMALEMEDRFPVVDILEQTPPIPEECQWALFIRNHDELTLEMVSDEERDYMYRMYASESKARINLGIRRRLAPLLSNNRRKIEIMNFLLFSLHGSPVIYYGDEIGMGDNFYLGDRNGVRTPMQWSPDKNAGFSKASPQELYLPIIIEPEYHYEAINVENQEKNPSSLLWWMRRIIEKRNKYRAFSRGALEFIYGDNPKIISFLRIYNEQVILVIANLSRFAQHVELNLSKYKGFTPIELFSNSPFPKITEDEYLFMLGPHDHFWFLLESPKQKEIELKASSKKNIPEIEISGHWSIIMEGRYKDVFEEQILPEYFNRTLQNTKVEKIEIIDSIKILDNPASGFLLLLHLNFRNSERALFLFPLSFIPKEIFPETKVKLQDSIVALVKEIGNGKTKDRTGYICYGTSDRVFRSQLLHFIKKYDTAHGKNGTIYFHRNRLSNQELQSIPLEIHSDLLKGEHESICILYEQKIFLKLYPKLFEGKNPEVQAFKLFSEKNFDNIPYYIGDLEYRDNRNKNIYTLGVVTRFINKQKNGVEYLKDEIGKYVERIISEKYHIEETLLEKRINYINTPVASIAEDILQLLGKYFVYMMETMGKRTAELHCLLAGKKEDPQYCMEDYTLLYQRSLYQSYRNKVKKVIRELSYAKSKFDEDTITEINSIVVMENLLLEKGERMSGRELNAKKIRIHGDYILENLIYTGKDFVIVDFEGNSSQPYSQRIIKRSPLRDLASLVYSIYKTAYRFFTEEYFKIKSSVLKEISLEKWADFWYNMTCGIFITSYCDFAKEKSSQFFDDNSFSLLFPIFLIEWSLNEIENALYKEGEDLVTPIRYIKNVVEYFKE